jgi:hypothetical protein
MYPIRLKSGNWVSMAGVSESQHSLAGDSEACLSFSACHVLESQGLFLTGFMQPLSPRFLAAVSHTTMAGNTYEAVYNAILKYGICIEATWPIPAGNDWTWDEFYATPPPEAYNEAKAWLNTHSVEFVTDCAESLLTTAPLWTEVNLGYTTHGIEQLNTTQELDSEPNGGDPTPYVKPLSPVVHFNLLLLTIKNMPQIGTQDLGGELRIVIKAATPDQWNAACMMFGRDPAAPVDETVTLNP